uniref:hypothetical protein n=1 Tax=Candidatus Wolbachia massiliensis TaxID=1845000 RepID=UPI0037BFD47F
MPPKSKVSFCRDENGIVEMQKTKGFEKRAYAAKQDRLKILNFIAIAAVSGQVRENTPFGPMRTI